MSSSVAGTPIEGSVFAVQTLARRPDGIPDFDNFPALNGGFAFSLGALGGLRSLCSGSLAFLRSAVGAKQS